MYDKCTSGAIVYAYSPYGEATTLGPDGGNPLQYTGRENDGTGLYYYRARYYDPVLKQWLSEDPIGLAGGINLRQYINSNPISFTDPLGLFGGPFSKWMHYGNWAGENYSGGQYGPQIPSNPASPVSPMDSCFRDHDYCQSSWENGCLSDADKSRSKKACDQQLVKCLERLGPDPRYYCSSSPWLCRTIRGGATTWFSQ